MYGFCRTAPRRISLCGRQKAHSRPGGKGLTGKGCRRRGAGQEAKRIDASLLTTIEICGHGPDPIRQTGGDRGDPKCWEKGRRLRPLGCGTHGVHIFGRYRPLLLGQKLGYRPGGPGSAEMIEREFVLQSPKTHSEGQHQNEEQCRSSTPSCRVNCEQSAGPWRCVFCKSRGPDGCNQ